jgi:hypothetical protein
MEDWISTTTAPTRCKSVPRRATGTTQTIAAAPIAAYASAIRKSRTWPPDIASRGNINSKTTSNATPTPSRIEHRLA